VYTSRSIIKLKFKVAAFHLPKVNLMFKKILNVWCKFLSSPESCYVLNTEKNGWLSPDALSAMNIDQYIHDKNKPFYGFTSWNDFFTRKFKPGMRPISDPNNDKVIVSAAESTPYSIAHYIDKDRDTFWIKQQPYSLYHMLNGNHVKEFIGGTIFQAFLSAKEYHCWHSPVSGVIKSIKAVEGTYYAQAESVGFDVASANK
jgi:phosphatidylserine decarboxylase